MRFGLIENTPGPGVRDGWMVCGWGVGGRRGYYLNLFAGVHVDMSRARLALDMTTPVEFTFATFLQSRLHRVVASAAAHQIAPVHVVRCAIADASLGAEGAQRAISDAVIRRVFQVDEVVRCGKTVAGILQLQPPPSVYTHFRRPVVLISNVITWKFLKDHIIYKSRRSGV